MDAESKEYYLAGNLNALAWEVSSKGMSFENSNSVFEFYILNVNVAAGILYWSPLSKNPIAKGAAPIIFKLLKKHLYACNIQDHTDLEQLYSLRCKYYSGKLKTGINDFDSFSRIYDHTVSFPLTVHSQQSMDLRGIHLFTSQLEEHLNLYTDAVEDAILAIIED